MTDCQTSCDRGRCLRKWYATPLGRRLAHAELSAVDEVLAHRFGYHIVQVGAPQEHATLLERSPIRHRVVLDRSSAGTPCTLTAHASALPFAADSVDVLVLYHALEFEDNPHQVLREAERVLIPDGSLVIVGFNPLSLWGLLRALRRRRGIPPWCGQFIGATRLRDWLSLLGFKTGATRCIFYRPPTNRPRLLDRLASMEVWGPRWWRPLAGIHIMVARKKVATLTPIRPRWAQRRAMGRPRLIEPAARRTQTNE